MKITLETDGGFAAIPRLNQPFTVDTASIVEPSVGSELVRLVHEARSSGGRRQTSPGDQQGGDRQTFRITVSEGDSRYTLEYQDPVAEPVAQALVERLQALSRGEAAAS